MNDLPAAAVQAGIAALSTDQMRGVLRAAGLQYAPAQDALIEKFARQVIAGMMEHLASPTGEADKTRLTLHVPKTDPALLAALEKARTHKLTPEEYAAQARSWVRGEMMMDHPEITTEEADALIDRALPHLARPAGEVGEASLFQREIEQLHERLAAAEAERDALKEWSRLMREDQAAVWVNMLRGGIAWPSHLVSRTDANGPWAALSTELDEARRALESAKFHNVELNKTANGLTVALEKMEAERDALAARVRVAEEAKANAVAITNDTVEHMHRQLAAKAT